MHAHFFVLDIQSIKYLARHAEVQISVLSAFKNIHHSGRSKKRLVIYFFCILSAATPMLLTII
jgi:hypothetical protein